jgi:hypothetical protein
MRASSRSIQEPFNGPLPAQAITGLPIQDNSCDPNYSDQSAKNHDNPQSIAVSLGKRFRRHLLEVFSQDAVRVAHVYDDFHLIGEPAQSRLDDGIRGGFGHGGALE